MEKFIKTKEGVLNLSVYTLQKFNQLTKHLLSLPNEDAKADVRYIFQLTTDEEIPHEWVSAITNSEVIATHCGLPYASPAERACRHTIFVKELRRFCAQYTKEHKVAVPMYSDFCLSYRKSKGNPNRSFGRDEICRGCPHYDACDTCFTTYLWRDLRGDNNNEKKDWE